MYTTQFYESYIPNNKPNKHNPNNQNNNINVGFTTNTKFVLLQLRQHKFWSIHTHISTNFKKHIQPISYILSITNLYISSIPKNLYVDWWTISYISSIPTWICYQILRTASLSPILLGLIKKEYIVITLTLSF